MERLRNFIYDKNDIVVALIIVAIAALIIAGRIDTIMSYPDKMAAEAALAADGQDDAAAAPAGQGQASYSEGDGSGAAAPDGEATPVYPAPDSGSVYPGTPTVPEAGTAEDGAADDNGAADIPPAVANITVTIPSGTTGDGIAQILVSNGLIAQKSDFTNAVAAAGADRKLKAGTFVVPSNATPAQIVSIITQ